MNDPFRSRSTLALPGGETTLFRLDALTEAGLTDLAALPFSIRVLLENVLRHAGGPGVSEQHVAAVAGWKPQPDRSVDIPFMPGRVVLQDFTGVPAVVDLAAMRDAMAALGADPDQINPLVQTDLVIDHSVQVDHYGADDAFARNVEREMERNAERYALLRWAQQAFDNFRVVPTGTGIVHQVNLEYLASVVRVVEHDGQRVAFPDTLVGTDSHTTMINGLGVMGWGVGGIEAEAVMLGQPYFMPLPEVVGMRLTGQLPVGATATDLVLMVTEQLRAVGVVGRFVEFFGEGMARLPLADRATIANMAPEYGATMGFFPVDDKTLAFLEATGRPAELVERVRRYCQAQHLLYKPDGPQPEYTTTVALDLGDVVPSLAGPRRPQDRVALGDMKPSFARALGKLVPAGAARDDKAIAPTEDQLGDGSVVIAAITSCTNTSNPYVMMGAGLLARNAAAKGLTSKPWVKTSLAPGSKVVTEYLKAAGLLEPLESLGFHHVGYGCTTCIGNSGPLSEPIAKAIADRELVVAAVLSGNRNFEARIHSLIRANYLGSPLLVVAYAIAGRIDVDFEQEPLGRDADGKPVFLRDIWPDATDVAKVVGESLRPEMYATSYATVFEGDERWNALPLARGEGGRFGWDDRSTYIANPPFFAGMNPEPAPTTNITGARVLMWLGDTVTTDHISPAGAIGVDSPAGKWLLDRQVTARDFNTFGSRRGHHEVMMRGTFANVRIRNKLAGDTEGGVTVHLPSGDPESVYDAAQRYQAEGTPLLVIAGKEYGTGSSRDWAAKGTALLGVKAVVAESYERIHRGNLVGMGVLPLQFQPGESATSLGLAGQEIFDVDRIADGELTPGGTAHLEATRPDGTTVEFDAVVRLDTAIELEYYRHGGILTYVVRQLSAAKS
ncbi:MAG: aconitate hydratase AcnA [Deltaproteobacteria bacterium]|nr:aconitate hydratase AcnA [Deltaproteobacteria bacterium]